MLWCYIATRKLERILLMQTSYNSLDIDFYSEANTINTRPVI